MMNKKGSYGWIWVLVIIFILINAGVITNAIIRRSINKNIMTGEMVKDIAKEDMIKEERYEELQREQQQEDYYQQQMEEELQRQQEETYYQQQMEEELQRQYEQEQYEDMLREQQQEDYYPEQSQPETTTIKCTDSDSGKDYYTKGYITHTDGTKEYDECGAGAYKDYVNEHYCTTTGTGTLNYECQYGCSDGKCNSKPQITAIIVSYVSDGDTFKLSTGETVRLIGLNAPESGQPCSPEATAKLKEFVLGKEVTLEQDVDDKDQYGRLLRYVYVDNTFINLEMVRLGLAHKYEYGSNTKYSVQFEQAENEAKQNDGCLWKSEEINYIQDQCIYIINFHFNAVGNDNYNLNDEYVSFGNKCSYPIDMTTWTVKDETASHIFTLPSFTFDAGATFTLYTGTGTNTNSALYWGRTSGDYAAIWNNKGDTLFLRDSNGNLVLTQSYSGY